MIERDYLGVMDQKRGLSLPEIIAESGGALPPLPPALIQVLTESHQLFPEATHLFHALDNGETEVFAIVKPERFHGPRREKTDGKD